MFYHPITGQLIRYPLPAWQHPYYHPVSGKLMGERKRKKWRKMMKLGRKGDVGNFRSWPLLITVPILVVGLIASPFVWILGKLKRSDKA